MIILPDRVPAPRPPPDPDLLTISDAMTLAGVSRRTIYNWLAKRWIDAVYTVSGRPRILAASLAHRLTKARA
jgi:predicted site-specific integrase-resolvase